MPRSAPNLGGARFGILTAVERVPGPNHDRSPHWMCQCDCGGTRVVRSYLLIGGRVKCCGCSQRAGNQHTPVVVRFWRCVDRRADDECWTWNGARSRGAVYGTLNVSGKVTCAHRFSYEIHKGPIPDGLFIDHLCMNKLCVNPKHLDAVTPAENTRRWAATITCCPSGHKYDEDNTYVAPDGKRACRTCHNIRSRQRRADARSIGKDGGNG